MNHPLPVMYLDFIQWDHNRQAALAAVSPALQQSLLRFNLLLLPFHTPLALPQSVQVLLVLQQLGLQLLALTAQPLSLPEAMLLPLLQQAFLFTL